MLLRLVVCTRGTVPVRVEYVPRPEYGLVHPLLRADGAAIVSRGGSTVLVFSTEVAMDLSDATASAIVSLAQDEDLAFAVAQCDPWGPIPAPWSRREVDAWGRGMTRRPGALTGAPPVRSSHVLGP